MLENELKELMLKENKEFKRVYEQHQQYDKELDKFREKAFLTEEEKLEEKELKKKKLVLKDKMYWMMEEFRRSL